MQLSIVIPCLNEVETIGICISKCNNSLNKMNIKSEIIVADNGSTDGSIEKEKLLGAKVVNIDTKGYGSTLIGGIKKAKGKYIIMADADDSYDFTKINDFFLKLEEGYDIVQGCRFPIGGGKIENKAMPISHRYFGNPFFSMLSKLFFSLPFNDVYCGYRGFNREKFIELDHFSNGMVFALENLIKFKVSGAKCAEIPVTLYKDGRKKSKSHLNTISDGWMTLKFLLLTCPRWLFFVPSIVFLIISFFKSSEVILSEQLSEGFMLNSFFSIFFYFLISFQLFMFGLFSSLSAVKLKMLESNFLLKFFKVFKIRIAFFISLFLFGIIIVDNYFFEFIPIEKNLKSIIYYFINYFSVILIINTLFVSLLTINDQNKKNI